MYCRMLQGSKGHKCSSPRVMKIYSWFFLEWPFYTGFTVYMFRVPRDTLKFSQEVPDRNFGSLESAILFTFIKLPFVIKIFVLLGEIGHENKCFVFWRVAVSHRFYCYMLRVPRDTLKSPQEVPDRNFWCLSGLQYFRPSLSYHLLLRSLFCLFLNGRFTQVLLYIVKDGNHMHLENSRF